MKIVVPFISKHKQITVNERNPQTTALPRPKKLFFYSILKLNIYINPKLILKYL